MKKEERMSKSFRPIRSELLKTSLDIESMKLNFHVMETGKFYCKIKIGGGFRIKDYPKSFFTFLSTEKVDGEERFVVIASDGKKQSKFYDNQIGSLAMNKSELDLRELWRPKLSENPLEIMLNNPLFEDVHLEFARDIPPIVFNRFWRNEYYTDGKEEKTCLFVDDYWEIRHSTYVLKILNPVIGNLKYHLIFNELIDIHEVTSILHNLKKGESNEQKL